MFAKTMLRDGRVQFGVLCVAVGIAYLAIGLSRDEIGFTITGFVVMIAYGGLLLVFRKRAEPLALLSGNPSDERQAQVMLRASALTAHMLIVVIVAGVMITLATGSAYAGVFSGLAAVGGVSFILATVWYSRRG